MNLPFVIKDSKQKSKKMNILIIYGANLNLIGLKSAKLGTRITLDKINKKLRETIKNKNVSLKILQSNDTGKVINFIQKNRKWANGILISPSSWCLNQFALLETLQICNIPTIEVYLNKKYDKNEFYVSSIFSNLCINTIVGEPIEIFSNALNEILNLTK